MTLPADLRILDVYLAIALPAAFIVLTAAAAVWPKWTAPIVRVTSRATTSLARHGVLWISVLALACVIIFDLTAGHPVPKVQDEFSYLLQSDTFASGRMANPTHPQWVYFESPHILQVPTYVSFYPPGSGTFLAFGQRFLGHPWHGVALAWILMAASVCWMLQGWMPRRWAFLGALLLIQLMAFRSWMSTYWGGAVAATGGALLYGALPRAMRTRQKRYFIVLGVGLLLMANSRPYEGMIASLPVAASLAVWLWKQRSRNLGLLLTRSVLPLGLTLAAGASVMMLYNYRTTGHPLRLPYMEGFKQYMYRRMFLWQSNRPRPEYRHKEIARLYYDLERPGMSWTAKMKEKIKNNVSAFLHPLLLFPLLMLFFVWRDTRVRFLLLSLAVFLAGLFVEEWVWPHYAAPGTCLIIAFVIQCIRHFRTLRWNGHRIGRFASALLFLLGFAIMGSRELRAWMSVEFPTPWQFERLRIGQELRQSTKPDLVVVRYGRRHYPHDEWVYNAADIDSAPVVWAREMAQMRPLLEHFKDSRCIWLLEADERPLVIKPYRPLGNTEPRPGENWTPVSGCYLHPDAASLPKRDHVRHSER